MKQKELVVRRGKQPAKEEFGVPLLPAMSLLAIAAAQVCKEYYRLVGLERHRFCHSSSFVWASCADGPIGFCAHLHLPLPFPVSVQVFQFAVQGNAFPSGLPCSDNVCTPRLSWHEYRLCINWQDVPQIPCYLHQRLLLAAHLLFNASSIF